jgi:hypothetical protein
MLGTDHSLWLYNQQSIPTTRPGDLGYFMGRRICEAYATKQNSLPDAVRGILQIQDASQFLKASGYAG